MIGASLGWAIGKRVLGFLGGPIMKGVESMLGRYLDHKSTKVREGASLAKTEIEAHRLQLAENARIIRAEQGHWYTRIVRPALAFPLVLHFGMISFASTFPQYGITVHPLPEPMNEWEGVIILSYFIARPAEKLGTLAIHKVFK